jgi:hypothetical protein
MDTGLHGSLSLAALSAGIVMAGAIWLYSTTLNASEQ